MKKDKHQRVGIIDVGSNTIRLVIFDIDSHYRIDEIQNIKTPARLVQYINDDIMSEKGIQQLVRILSSYLKIAAHYHLDELIPVATAAVRNSANHEEIVACVKKATGLDLRILSGKEEAFFGNYAVRHSVHVQNGLSVDIGGASTELTLYENKKVVKSFSFPFGAVSLKQDFLTDKSHNDPTVIKQMKKMVRQAFQSKKWLKDAGIPLIGIGGSIRNIAEVHQLAHNYPLAGMHEYEMNAEQVKEVLNLFTGLSVKELKNLDGLSNDRVDTIIPATIVFEELMKLTGSDRLIVSSQGLREGILIHYLNSERPNTYALHHIKQQTAVRLSNQYRLHEIAIQQRLMIIEKLLDSLQKENLFSLSEQDSNLLFLGATLYYLGSYIENNSRSQHTFYILSNSNLIGFSHRERVCVALIASYKNKTLFKQYMSHFVDWFSDQEEDTIMKMGCLVKFAEALNDSQVNPVEDLVLERTGDQSYQLQITYSGEIIAEQYRASKQLNHFERVVGSNVQLYFVDPQTDSMAKK